MKCIVCGGELVIEETRRSTVWRPIGIDGTLGTREEYPETFDYVDATIVCRFCHATGLRTGYYLNEDEEVTSL